jgi:O-antigen/teichoic acid export membrane protein
VKDKLQALRGSDRLRARTLRGMMASVMLSFGTQGLRLISNLVLTRLLFPEAFGLIALVQVVLMGLQMVSEVGLHAAVIQNKRADEPVFLHTVWGIQILRNGLLWLIACAAAPFFAWLYEEPMLLSILPVAGFSLVISGFHTTRILQVQRHMNLGLFSTLTIVTHALGLTATGLLAWWLGTVWALAYGMIAQSTISLLVYAYFLPGVKDRFRLDKETVFEIMNFGKFLFFSSAATYVISNSDRIILGLFIPLDLLGVYGLALALGTLPIMLSTNIAHSVVFPLYRLCHPMDALENQTKIFKLRRLIALASLSINAILAALGPWLVGLLYDDRYALAGGIIILLCASAVPNIVMNGAMNAALVRGDSFRFMVANVAIALSQTILMYIAVSSLGVVGAPLAMVCAPILTYPLIAKYLKRYGNFDFIGDIGLMILGFAVCGMICMLHVDAILQLLP